MASTSQDVEIKVRPGGTEDSYRAACADEGGSETSLRDMAAYA